MNKENKIDQEVQKTLALLEKSKPLKADAHFYTRLKARMDREANKHPEFLNIHFGWKALAPVLIIIMIAANVYTASVFLKTQDDAKAQKTELISLFAADWTLDSSQYNPTLIFNE